MEESYYGKCPAERWVDAKNAPDWPSGMLLLHYFKLVSPLDKDLFGRLNEQRCCLPCSRLPLRVSHS